ncbi:MAG: hypothetical protein EPN91_02440 [Salinibacterium sp.]|nr:MAG: hypothetical protein EPN91_02440 [Salinibacterium sp.]
MGYIADSLGKTEVCFFHLIEIVGTERKWTNCEIPLRTTGDFDAPAGVWKPLQWSFSGLSIQSVTINSLGSIELASADWLDAPFGPNYLFLTEVFSEAAIKIYGAWLDPEPTNTTVKEDELIFSGTCGEPELPVNNEQETLRMQLQEADPDSRTFPNEKISRACSFEYKNALSCQSTSTDTFCPRDLVSCQTRTGGSNESHFGGKTDV